MLLVHCSRLRPHLERLIEPRRRRTSFRRFQHKDIARRLRTRSFKRRRVVKINGRRRFGRKEAIAPVARGRKPFRLGPSSEEASNGDDEGDDERCGATEGGEDDRCGLAVGFVFRRVGEGFVGVCGDFAGRCCGQFDRVGEDGDDLTVDGGGPADLAGGVGRLARD